MNKKLVKEFLIITFVIMLIFWGGCALISQIFNLTINNIGTANANMNYFLFGIMCLTLCYALATIRKVSKGVFPCILTHCLINGLSAIFVFNYSLLSCCITLIVTIIVSILILNVNKRYIR